MMRSSHLKKSATVTNSQAHQTRSQAALKRVATSIPDERSVKSKLMPASSSSITQKMNVSSIPIVSSRTGFSESDPSTSNCGMSTRCRRSTRYSVRKEHQCISKQNSKVSSRSHQCGKRKCLRKRLIKKKNSSNKKTAVDKLYSQIILEQKNFMESHKRNQDMQISLLRQLVELQRRSVSIQQEILNTLTGYNLSRQQN